MKMSNRKLKIGEKEARKETKNPDELLEQLRSEIILRIDAVIKICSFLQKSAKEQGVKLDWKNSRERKDML